MYVQCLFCVMGTVYTFRGGSGSIVSIVMDDFLGGHGRL